MSTTLLQSTQKIRGFQHKRFEYCKEKLIWIIKRKEFHCPRCGSLKVRTECVRIRDIQGLPMGRHPVYFRIKIHRLYCPVCHRRNFEHLHFLSSANARITKALEQQIIKERHEMSIRSIAMKYHLRWELVKEIEKHFLGRKHAHVSAAHVRKIGIDEIHIGRNSDRTFRFLTIVRDLQSGAVIHVGNGYGISGRGQSSDSQEHADALQKIDRRLYAEGRIEKHLCNRIQCPRSKSGISPLGLPWLRQQEAES